MIRQLQHVVKTYLSRKLIWLFALFYAFVIRADTISPVRDQPLLWQETQVRWLPRKEFDGMTAFLNWPATDAELRELRGLRITGQIVVPSDKLGPNGKPTLTLKRDSEINHEALAKLAKCETLTELHWFSVRLTPDVGQVLAKLPSLRHLELSLIGDPVASMEHLPTLANLRFFQVPQVPPAELGLLARHPLLTTVEVHDSVPQRPVRGQRNTKPFEIWQQPATLHAATQIERVIIEPINEHTKAVFEGVRYDQIPREATQKTVPISENLLSDLSKLPNLKAVEIRNPRGGWQAKTIDDPRVRNALAHRPEVAINPVATNIESLLSPFTAFSSIFILTAIGIQLFSQFRASWSLTVPAFARPHLVIAAAILIVHLLIMTTIIVTRRHVAFMPAFALVSAIPAVVAFVAAFAARRPTMVPFLFPIAMACGMAATMGLSNLIRATCGEAFFDGQKPGLTLAILLAEAAAILWAGRSVTQLPQRFCEAGIPSGLSYVQTMQQLQMQKLKKSGHTGTGVGWNWQPVDRRIESFLARNDFADRRRQWRCGEPIGWRHILLMCLLAPWLVVGVFVLTISLLSGQAVSPESYVFYAVVLGTFSLTLATFILAGGSQARRPVLQQELLRPMIRSEMQQHLRSSIWMDLWPALLITLGYLFALPVVHSWGPAGWSSQSWIANTLGHALLCLMLPLPIWAGMLLLLTIPKEFWRVFFILLGYFLLFGVMQAFTMMRVLQSPNVAVLVPYTTYWLAGACMILGLTLAWWAGRRLSHVEWGRSG